MPRVTQLAEIFKMLDHCAEGHERKPSREYWTIKFGGKTYRSLPLGPHGRRINPNIETGYVRSLIRHLGIDRGCAEKYVDLS